MHIFIISTDENGEITAFQSNVTSDAESRIKWLINNGYDQVDDLDNLEAECYLVIQGVCIDFDIESVKIG